MKKLFAIVFASAAGLGTFATGAQATTLGLIAPPSGSSSGGCPPNVVTVQATNDPATPYVVPGPGTITGWQMITSDDAAGADLTFLVIKPAGDAFSVVAVDPQTIDTPAPDLSSFTFATPIAVSGGETFGIYSNDVDVVCFFHGGSTPASDTLMGLAEPNPPAAGQTLERTEGSDPGFTLNAAATFEPTPTTSPTTPPAPPATHKKTCKKKKHKRSAESAKKRKCKKKKKR